VANFLKIPKETLVQDPLAPLREFDVKLLPKPSEVKKHWNLNILFCKLFVAFSEKQLGGMMKHTYATGQRYYTLVEKKDPNHTWFSKEMQLYLEDVKASAPERSVGGSRSGSTKERLKTSGYYVGKVAMRAAFSAALAHRRVRLSEIDPVCLMVDENGEANLSRDIVSHYVDKYGDSLTKTDAISECLGLLNQKWIEQYNLKLTVGKENTKLMEVTEEMNCLKKVLGNRTFCFLHYKITGQVFEGDSGNNSLPPINGQARGPTRGPTQGQENDSASIQQASQHELGQTYQSQVLFGGTGVEQATIPVPQTGESQSPGGFQFEAPVSTEMGDVSTRPIRRAQRQRTTEVADPTHSALETDIDDDEPLQTTVQQTRRLVRSRSIHM
jgi:hypothetical protein